MVKKIWSQLNFLKTRLFLTPAEQEFRNFNLRNSSSPSSSAKRIRVLMQMPEDSFYLILFSSIARLLRRDYSVEIGWIHVETEFEFKTLVQKFRKWKFYYRRWKKLYLSNGGEIVFWNMFHKERVLNETRANFEKALAQIKTKEDVLQITYQDISLGDLIYDTYLRFKPAATIDLNDEFLQSIILCAFDYVDRQAKLFTKARYDYLFTSYTSYIHHGVMVKSALKFGVKVISFGSYVQFAKTVNGPHVTHHKEYDHYRATFAALPEEGKVRALEKAKVQLNSRFEGAVDSSTYYMTKSAYHSDVNTPKVFKDTGKKKIVLFLHCFFDSPHIHAYMYYADFLAWTIATIRILKSGPHDFYVKPHPNGVPGNDEVIDEILKMFPDINMIPKTVSNRVLIREGFDLALTVYGTLGHEFPYFGIPVLNAGDNPHINYDFCVHPKSREEYEYLLTHIEEIPKPTEQSRDQIFEFYHMHSSHQFPGMLEDAENTYINDELRFIQSSGAVSKYVRKCKEPGYREKLDQLISKSIKPLL